MFTCSRHRYEEIEGAGCFSFPMPSTHFECFASFLPMALVACFSRVTKYTSVVWLNIRGDHTFEMKSLVITRSSWRMHWNRGIPWWCQKSSRERRPESEPAICGQRLTPPPLQGQILVSCRRRFAVWGVGFSGTDKSTCGQSLSRLFILVRTSRFSVRPRELDSFEDVSSSTRDLANFQMSLEIN